MGICVEYFTMGIMKKVCLKVSILSKCSVSCRGGWISYTNIPFTSTKEAATIFKAKKKTRPYRKLTTLLFGKCIQWCPKDGKGGETERQPAHTTLLFHSTHYYKFIHMSYKFTTSYTV